MSVPLLHQWSYLADRLLLQATEVELYEIDDDFSPLLVCVVLLAP